MRRHFDFTQTRTPAAATRAVSKLADPGAVIGNVHRDKTGRKRTDMLE